MVCHWRLTTASYLTCISLKTNCWIVFMYTTLWPRWKLWSNQWFIWRCRAPATSAFLVALWVYSQRSKQTAYKDSVLESVKRSGLHTRTGFWSLWRGRDYIEGQCPGVCEDFRTAYKDSGWSHWRGQDCIQGQCPKSLKRSGLQRCFQIHPLARGDSHWQQACKQTGKLCFFCRCYNNGRTDFLNAIEETS